jgi:hypothetical protein
MNTGISYEEQVELNRYARGILMHDYQTIREASTELNELAQTYYPEIKNSYSPQTKNQIKEKELKKEFKNLEKLII